MAAKKNKSHRLRRAARFLSGRSALVETLEPRRVLAGIPVISEFMASNVSTLQDADGEFSDWVEIRNVSPTDPVDLEGWFLSDNADNLVKWRFPGATLDPGDAMIVFASGKNRTDPTMELHTNFKLASAGEFLALVRPDGRTVVTDYSPTYPQQMADISYGTSSNLGDASYFQNPTPGAANAEGQIGLAAETSFSVPRGFYDKPLQVRLATATDGATIRFTLDGSEPSATEGEVYTAPIAIETTSTLRAVAVKDLLISSDVTTATYIFVNDVIAQGNSPVGYPSLWKSGDESLPGDYEMDPEVTSDPAYRDILDDALLSIPTISIVTEIDNLFDRATGIYQNPGMSGVEWERPVSVELLYPDGTPGFQIDAGLRIQGRASRQPTSSPKHSFRLLFKKIYGAGQLEFPFFNDADAVDSFDTIVLRAGFNNSWIHGSGIREGERERSQYIRDQWAKDTQLAMGHPSARNNYVHLYLNGIYWGLYNPTERPSDSFAAAYLGGEREDYDIINSNQVKQGDNIAWRAMLLSAKAGLEGQAEYEAFQELLDIPAFIDYIILNHYGANDDWGNSNFYAIRNRETDGRFRFVSWDAESIFINLDDNIVTQRSSAGPPGLQFALSKNAEYRLLFADHVQRLLFDDGLLTPQSAIQRWNRRSDQVFDAVVAESARWGDYRRDVDPALPPKVVYLRDEQWAAERERMLEEYFPQRSDILLSQYRDAGIFPNVDAPVFSQRGGQVDADFQLSLANPNGSGTIYFTRNGSDPRLMGGDVSTTAQPFEDPITITQAIKIKSRVLGDDGQWSALSEADFLIREPGDANGDGLFNTADWITVLQAGEFEDNIEDNSTFEEGDWDGDGDFTSRDIVFALQFGIFAL